MKFTSVAARLWLIIWLVLAAALLTAGRDLFVVPTYEEADDAANALNIARAKRGAELYGNYSRYNFNHPGPAFFYVYALGETLLHDQFHLTPTRHNAHLLALALLQAACFAGVLSIAASITARPVTVAALITTLALLHFAFVPGAFLVLWPPFVLILPFALFLVTAAHVSGGGWSSLPWLALSGGFLVHGHVAQSLFVGPLAIIALVLGLRSSRAQGTNTTPTRRIGLITVGLVALFLLPLMLDVALGRDSNLYRILLHLRSNAQPATGFVNAAGSTLSYFGYCTHQEQWWGIEAKGTWQEFFGRHYPGLIVWSTILTVAVAIFRKIPRQSDVAALRFVRSLLLQCAGALALTVVWGLLQHGDITYFNSYFMFGLMLAILIAVTIYCGEILRPAWLRSTIPLAVIAVVAFEEKLYSPMYGLTPLGTEIEAHLPALLQADRQPLAPKVLVFSDDWVETVTLAAALQRRSIDFRVSPVRRVMFGADHVLRASEQTAQKGAVSWWRIVKTDKLGPNDLRIGPSTSLHSAAPPQLPTLPTLLDFSDNGNTGPYCVFGFSGPEKSFSWTEATIATLQFTAATTQQDIELTIDASALINATHRTQRAILHVNQRLVGSLSVGPERGLHRLRVPASTWNAVRPESGVELLLELPDAIVPSREQWTIEHRELALRVYAISIAPLESDHEKHLARDAGPLITQEPQGNRPGR